MVDQVRHNGNGGVRPATVPPPAKFRLRGRDIDQHSQGIAFINPKNGRIEGLNPAFKHLFGAGPGDSLLKTPSF